MAQAPLINPVPAGPLVGKDLHRMPAWGAWYQQVYDLVFGLQQSGTTANRPLTKLYIGKFYFDTTITKPIWVSAVTASVATWRDAAGLVV